MSSAKLQLKSKGEIDLKGNKVNMLSSNGLDMHGNAINDIAHIQFHEDTEGNRRLSLLSDDKLYLGNDMVLTETNGNVDLNGKELSNFNTLQFSSDVDGVQKLALGDGSLFVGSDRVMTIGVDNIDMRTKLVKNVFELQFSYDPDGTQKLNVGDGSLFVGSKRVVQEEDTNVNFHNKDLISVKSIQIFGANSDHKLTCIDNYPYVGSEKLMTLNDVRDDILTQVKTNTLTTSPPNDDNRKSQFFNVYAEVDDGSTPTPYYFPEFTNPILATAGKTIAIDAKFFVKCANKKATVSFAGWYELVNGYATFSGCSFQSIAGDEEVGEYFDVHVQNESFAVKYTSNTVCGEGKIYCAFNYHVF